jgi:hypothetical protein
MIVKIIADSSRINPRQTDSRPFISDLTGRNLYTDKVTHLKNNSHYDKKS